MALNKHENLTARSTVRIARISGEISIHFVITELDLHSQSMVVYLELTSE